MWYIILAIIAYIIGSIPFALIVGKWGYKVDIRNHGSGNLGGTNTFRVLGKRAGFIVTALDILKGTLAAALPLIFQAPDVNPLLIGVFAVVGHMYPLFAKFKGGKAVATSGGVLLFYAPVMFLAMVACFFLVLYLTKYVSLSSMLTGLFTFAYSLFTSDVTLIIAVGILTTFVIYRHRANIRRILNKTEPKIKWM
ncbi:glycerol-3-phosphate 1-O-acyltransferase PlsY [Bacillus sp. HMF5848]|uniref:glycerol-3-phosphate 1-O-acyltransferase PlsY n=1 Tax=Bacillus sp. HMF5848 TaxID=2495421 RepID=UPI000F76D8F7|nr:glycerol-3-phosphate 1-O-acyltransferase PlsY [Bacillus sp. HMF5848]RSK27150.1 glycerol-3-phosphate 1-O-acyltransferase PlsY [Bacillus sp. HMF5848]